MPVEEQYEHFLRLLLLILNGTYKITIILIFLTKYCQLFLYFMSSKNKIKSVFIFGDVSISKIMSIQIHSHLRRLHSNGS